jgi:hypothetical protein
MKDRRLDWLSSRPASHWAGDRVTATARKLDRLRRVREGARPQEIDPEPAAGRKRRPAPGDPRHHRDRQAAEA